MIQYNFHYFFSVKKYRFQFIGFEFFSDTTIEKIRPWPLKKNEDSDDNDVGDDEDKDDNNNDGDNHNDRRWTIISA